MRISKVAKKSMAVAMAMAVAVGSVAVAPTKDASCSKAKSKKVNARVFFAGNAKDADAFGSLVTASPLRLYLRM